MKRSILIYSAIAFTLSLTSSTSLKAVRLEELYGDGITKGVVPYLSVKDVNSLQQTSNKFYRVFNPQDPQTRLRVNNVVYKTLYLRTISSGFSGEKDVGNWKEFYKFVRFLQGSIRTGQMPHEHVITHLMLQSIKQGSGLWDALKASFRGHNSLTTFKLYKLAEKKGNNEIKRSVNLALVRGYLGQGARPEAERFIELELRAAQGDKHALGLVIEALYRGELGQGARLETERFAKLQQMADQGDKEAQYFVYQALFTGNLGQDAKPKAERFAKLQLKADQGDKDAQHFINNAFFTGNLGQNVRSEAERFAELQQRAAQGDKHALSLVIEALYTGTFGQNARPEVERFAKLQQMANEGNEDAQCCLSKALFNGLCLGQNIRSRIERFIELQKRATQGDKHAQRSVALAIYCGYLGQYKRPALERFAELQQMAASQRNKEALRFIKEIFKGNSDSKGFRNLARPREDYQRLDQISRFLELLGHAARE